ncbi:hypothetical protein [Haloplasma contractile]|uniref:Uncharacterized protein n=1 Tax=Haloplasma contractile SSD-17B TaxID=1033810 RepID=F7Q0C4_9MOLU|nr:hypothetical protein [Haloplasma contractile]ERJ12730.1 hypothetical protein HLPCO_001070 [Haloplasma contractile SSD-17B]
MKKLLLKLHNEYKSIITLKNTNPFEINKWKTFRNMVITTLVFLLLFIGIGYISDQLDNLHYVVLAVNTSIIGPFILSKISNEIKFQAHYNLHYRIGNLIFYQSFNLITLILLSNGLFMLLYFRFLISTYFLLLLLAIPTVLILGICFLQYRLKLRRNYAGNILFNSLIIVNLYILLFHIIGIEMIVLNYVISTFIILIIYMISNTVSIPFVKSYNTLSIKVWSIGVLFTLIILMSALINNKYVDQHVEFISYNDFRTSKVNVIDDFEHLETPEHIYESDILVNDDYIFLDFDELLVLNHDLELVKRVDKNIGQIFMDNEIIKGVTSGDHLVGNHDNGWYIQYYLDQNFEFKEEILIHVDEYDFPPSFTLGDDLITINNPTTDFILVHHGNFESTRYEAHHYEQNQIIFQDNQHVIYTKNGKLYKDSSNLNYVDGWYSNGKKLLIGETISIVDMSEYIKGNEEPIFQYNVGKRLNTNYYSISSFDYYQNRYFIRLDGIRRMTLILNENGEEIGLVDYTEKSYYLDYNIFAYINEDFIFFLDSHGDLKLVDYENPTTYIFKGMTGTINHMFLYANLFILISFKKKIYLN